MEKTSPLAILGGPRAIDLDPADMFAWPIITREDEEAVLDVLRRRAMSGIDVTRQFEKEFAAWQGRAYALGFSSGTASLQAAMYACGVGVGDQIICPSLTYWASALQCFSLGASVVFADIDPLTLCLDPTKIEQHITPRTKALMVVHYLGYPADMDAIMEVARKHHLRVIEDVSHAQGGFHRGGKLGTFGDVAAMSLMTGKSLAAGEAGMLVTDDTTLYERALSLGHYERFDASIASPSLKPFVGLPLGGYKYRMHQMSSAIGRVQLAHYDERIEEIQKAMNRFWDGLEGVPGLLAHRPQAVTGSTKGGWYAPHGLYVPEQLGGLSVSRFCEALVAEGVETTPGCNLPLHLHPLLNDCDVYGHGVPTRNAHSDADLRQPPGSLPITEAAGARCFSIPWFKHDRPQIIDQYIHAFRKVVDGSSSLLEADAGNPPLLGGWHFFPHHV